MVKNEKKWPKDIKRWRVVLVNPEIEYYQAEANFGYILSSWEPAGAGGSSIEEVKSWIYEQCNPKETKRIVVWRGEVDSKF
jgi:hypothetical protein